MMGESFLLEVTSPDIDTISGVLKYGFDRGPFWIPLSGPRNQKGNFA